MKDGQCVLRKANRLLLAGAMPSWWVCLPSASWNAGMEKKMEATIIGYIMSSIRAPKGIHSFIPS